MLIKGKQGKKLRTWKRIEKREGKGNKRKSYVSEGKGTKGRKDKEVKLKEELCNGKRMEGKIGQGNEGRVREG